MAVRTLAPDQREDFAARFAALGFSFVEETGFGAAVVAGAAPPGEPYVYRVTGADSIGGIIHYDYRFREEEGATACLERILAELVVVIEFNEAEIAHRAAQQERVDRLARITRGEA